MNNIKQIPVIGSIVDFFDTYPRISAWAVLSIGMVGLLAYEARDVGLSTGNWISLIVATILVAGLCIWIVSWEDEEAPDSNVMRVKSEKSAEGEPSAKERS